jgi:hypothetical protein
MPTIRTPRGITPPTPGLDREEPTFVPEEDVPTPDAHANARPEFDDHPARVPERE